MKYTNNTNNKQKLFENVIVVLYTFTQVNTIHYDVIEEAFNSYMLSPLLVKAIGEVEYYSEHDDNLIEICKVLFKRT